MSFEDDFPSLIGLEKVEWVEYAEDGYMNEYSVNSYLEEDVEKYTTDNAVLKDKIRDLDLVLGETGLLAKYFTKKEIKNFTPEQFNEGLKTVLFEHFGLCE